MAGMGFEPRTETPRARLAILLWDADSDIGERRQQSQGEARQQILGPQRAVQSGRRDKKTMNINLIGKRM